MLEIRIDDAEVQAALGRLARQAADMSGPMADIARGLGNLTEDAFQAEKSPFGEGWPALDTDYVARPRNQGGRGGDAHPILQRTGRLAASISQDSGPDFARLSAGTEYAAIHQFGGMAGRGRRTRIHKRSYMPVSADGEMASVAQEEILDIITDALRAAVP